MSSEEGRTSEKIVFKPKKRKNLRQRRNSDDEDGAGDVSEDKKLEETLQETKERQKLRNRPNGVNVVGLALGKKISIEDEVTVKDPFNLKAGGMINMQVLKSGKLKAADDAYDTGIGTQFSAETNKRDEDEEMMKYIDEQLRKRKGQDSDNQDEEHRSEKYLSPEEAAILSLPSHLRLSSTQRSEEMLSNQMLNGIPEIDLGIEAKIRNIEATEEAKQKLLQDQKNKKDLPSHFVPKNMASNFIQHNRFNIEQVDQPKKRQYPDDNQGSNVPKKATDDYHFDKFKRQFRRH